MQAVRITTPDIQAFETEHTAAVRKLDPECMVLLKNDGTLPIAKGGRLALYGSGARRTIKGGTGSGDVNTRHFVTVEEGLEKAGYELTTKAWLDAYDAAVQKTKEEYFAGLRKLADEAGVNPMLFAMGKVAPEPEYEFPLDGEGDTAVYVLARISGEGADRTPTAGDINLTETEIRDILALNRKYKHFVLVLNIGGMVDLTPVNEVKNILLMGQLGTPSGDALADVLTGDAYPSGKLTMTWAPIGDYPSTEGFGDPNDTEYREGVYVGYRYFDTVNYAPTYPFGYGMGYTTFTVEPAGVALADGKITVTAEVTNTGKNAGKEVAQVYISAPEGKIDKPYQELKGYAKTRELAPGEKELLSITFEASSMASYSEKEQAWILEAGTYLVRVGNSSRDTKVAAALVLEKEVVTEKDKAICGVCGFTDWKPEKSAEESKKNTRTLASAQTAATDPTLASAQTAATDPTKAFDKASAEDQSPASTKAIPVLTINPAEIATKTITYSTVMNEIPSGETINWQQVTSGEKTVDDFIAGLTNDQLAYLCIGDYLDSDDILEVIGNASATVAGAAGETTNYLKELGLPSLVMADGPAGLRLSQEYQLKDGRAKGGSSLGGDMLLIYTEEERKAMTQVAQDNTGVQTYYQYCVAIPIGTEIAQSWNKELAETCGKLVGIEMGMFNCPIWLAPALNIHRSPLCGRNFEYYSEDPLVAGCVAAAITKGVQATPGCSTTIKHYAFNNQETNRYFTNSKISVRAMREIYLKAFEICVKESQPQFLMTSYNLINGEHTCNSKDIITHVLRDEWGFKGVVMTDWLVTGGMGPRGEVHPCASAAGNVKAGNDITMPGMPGDKADMLAALADANHPYHLTKAELQTCAKRVLSKILEMTTAQ